MWIYATILMTCVLAYVTRRRRVVLVSDIYTIEDAVEWTRRIPSESADELMSFIATQTRTVDEPVMVRLSHLHRRYGNDLGQNGYAINSIWGCIVDSHKGCENGDSKGDPTGQTSEREYFDERLDQCEVVEKPGAHLGEDDECEAVDDDTGNKALGGHAGPNDKSDEWWDPTDEKAAKAGERQSDGAASLCESAHAQPLADAHRDTIGE